MPTHVIYARKSTESEDRQVLSIESQIRELKMIALRRGIRVAEVLTESRSAKAPGRPVFGNLMRRVRKQEIEGVLCWKMDRLARNHMDTGLILQALADGALQEVITSDRTYTRDGNDRFMGNFELGMASKYIDDLRANVRRGNRARFERGWVNHNPPLGYLLDPTTKTIVKDPDRFDLVRRMWDLLLSGSFPPRKIRQIANERWGFRTRTFKRIGGKPISSATFYRMLGNPFYAGIIRLRSGDTYAGAHPPMVTQQEFERAQEILGRPGRPRLQHHSFPFTGLIRCGFCDGMVTAEEHVKPSGRRYEYYRCGRRKAGIVCREPAIPVSELEKQIAERLAGLAIPPKTLAWIMEKVERTFTADQKSSATARAALETAAAAVSRELDNLVGLRLRDLVDDAAFISRKRELDEKRAGLLQELRAPALTPQEEAKAVLASFSFAARAPMVFRQGSGVQKRMILEAVGLNYQLKDRKVSLDVKKPFSYIEKRDGSFTWSAMIEDVRTWIGLNGPAIPQTLLLDRSLKQPEIAAR
jgi:DNA invertase Pin-like site-specific DNA recombinase